MKNGKTIFISVILFAIGLIMFFGSFALTDDLVEREGWISTTATVTAVDFSTYENFNEEAITRHEEPRWWGEESVSYEFIREDGTVGNGTWWRRGLDTRDEEIFTSVGDVIDIIYDPTGSDSVQGYLPDVSSYIGAYVMRVIGILLLPFALLLIIFGRQKRSAKSESRK